MPSARRRPQPVSEARLVQAPAGSGPPTRRGPGSAGGGSLQDAGTPAPEESAGPARSRSTSRWVCTTKCPPEAGGAPAPGKSLRPQPHPPAPGPFWGPGLPAPQRPAVGSFSLSRSSPGCKTSRRGNGPAATVLATVAWCLSGEMWGRVPSSVSLVGAASDGCILREVRF